MARYISTINVYPLSSIEACQTVEAFRAGDGTLLKGITLIPDLSDLPLRWRLTIDRSCDAFDVLLTQLRSDPRITMQ